MVFSSGSLSPGRLRPNTAPVQVSASRAIAAAWMPPMWLRTLARLAITATARPSSRDSKRTPPVPAKRTCEVKPNVTARLRRGAGSLPAAATSRCRALGLLISIPESARPEPRFAPGEVGAHGDALVGAAQQAQLDAALGTEGLAHAGEPGAVEQGLGRGHRV